MHPPFGRANLPGCPLCIFGPLENAFAVFVGLPRNDTPKMFTRHPYPASPVEMPLLARCVQGGTCETQIADGREPKGTSAVQLVPWFADGCLGFGV